MRVFVNCPASMRAIWEIAAMHGDKQYLVYEDERYSYREVDAKVRALAHVLRHTHGVGSGDRVAVAMRNFPEWAISYWATVSVGASVVGMNAWWTGAEMLFALTDSRPSVMIVDDERLERVAPILGELRAAAPLHVIGVRTTRDLPSHGSYWADVVIPEDAPATLPEADIDPDDDATIFYTSGTTGFPKGAQLTHRGSVHNVMNLAFMNAVLALADSKAVESGDYATSSHPLEPGQQRVFMAPTPLFHVTANNCLLQPCTLAGGTIVFMHKWDAGRALELIEREKVTNFSGVPTMSRELLMHPDWATRDTSSMRGMGGGGAALQPDLVEKIDTALAGGSPATGYGLTETSGIITANSARLFLDKPSSCGRVVPTLDAKLIDDQRCDVTPSPDAIGELCVRGAVVIKGYLNRREASEEAIVDGWFRTGDIARIDNDGFVYIVDRAKDMVLRGGENVYCSEVEAALWAHPNVAEAAVFGIEDERLGEEVAAAVVPVTGMTLSDTELEVFLSERIARFKIPTKMWFLHEPLPRNANGKFLKRQLREQLTGE